MKINENQSRKSHDEIWHWHFMPSRNYFWYWL